MCRHAEFAILTNLPICSCGPRPAWQRGINENTNGLLRRHFREATISPCVLRRNLIE